MISLKETNRQKKYFAFLQKINRLPDPFADHKYKGYRFIPVLDEKAGVKYTKWHNKRRVIYYNSNFISKLGPGQKIFLAEASIRCREKGNPFRADEEAFNYVHSRYKVTQEEVGEMLVKMNFVNKAHKQDRIFNFVTESPDIVNWRNLKKQIKSYIKNIFAWKSPKN
jgi:hypothetical protein